MRKPLYRLKQDYLDRMFVEDHPRHWPSNVVDLLQLIAEENHNSDDIESYWDWEKFLLELLKGLEFQFEDEFLQAVHRFVAMKSS